MQNEDLALFARTDGEAYWMGNTETPSALWKTDKFGWREIPYRVSRWTQRELLATLHEEDPGSPTIRTSRGFPAGVYVQGRPRVDPVVLSRTRRWLPRRGSPGNDALFEDFLSTGVLDEYRHVMAGKLGTSDHVDRVRMSAAMGEFVAAKILTDAGYDVVPEIEVTTGHSLDFRARNGDTNVLVEVTRPQPPKTVRRRAPSPQSATPPRRKSTANSPNTAAARSCSSTARRFATTPGTPSAPNNRTSVTARSGLPRPPERSRRRVPKGAVPLELADALEFLD